MSNKTLYFTLLQISFVFGVWILEKGPTGFYEQPVRTTPYGESSPLNTPGSRLTGGTWTDSEENVWLFGGLRLSNDLWRFKNGEWALMKGYSFPAEPVHGERGVPHDDNLPGAREYSGYAANGNTFYLFGGFGRGSDGFGILNDLWKYDTATNQWTFLAGNETRNPLPSYVDEGSYSDDSSPGGREAVSMAAVGDVVFVFGGVGHYESGYDLLNDVWKYKDGQWGWFSGAGNPDELDPPYPFGEKGVSSPDVYPSPRKWAASWSDSSGNFWIFGGAGYHTTKSLGYLNDMWRFDSSNQWAWMGGSQGAYSPSDDDFPGARCLTSASTDSNGITWMFGGFGGSRAGITNAGHLNELWKFENDVWEMISGTESANATARFVGEGIANETNYPGGRYGSGAAISDSGLWISSGFGMDDKGNEGFLGDLWKYSFPVSEIVCGDGIVQDGEDCDGGICCTSECTFVASGVVCRESAGACDKPETCSGDAPSCPADEFLPSGTPCGEIVGFCDVLTQSTCEGDSAVCHGPPKAPAYLGSFGWENYAILSFGDFAASSGSIGGRVAVKGNAIISGGYSIGGSINTVTGGDRYVPFSFIAGHNAEWNSGSLSPSPNPSRPNDAPEYAYVGGNFTAPDYLKDRLWDNYPLTINDLSVPNFDNEFETARRYYSAISDRFAGFPTNVNVEEKWGGLFLTCADSSSSRYVANVDGAIFGRVTWYSLENCRFDADWILNIQGSGNVRFQGGQLPAIVERAVYNVLGTGRTIEVVTGLNGNILSPANSYNQPNGVTHGLVVVGNVLDVRSSTNPQCHQFQGVVITSQTSSVSQAGQNEIEVYSLSQFNLGDEITFTEGDENQRKRRETETKTITGARLDGDRMFIRLDSGLSYDWPAKTFIQATVENPSTTQRVPIEPDLSAAKTLTASFFLTLVAISFIC